MIQRKVPQLIYEELRAALGDSAYPFPLSNIRLLFSSMAETRVVIASNVVVHQLQSPRDTVAMVESIVMDNRRIYTASQLGAIITVFQDYLKVSAHEY